MGHRAWHWIRTIILCEDEARAIYSALRLLYKFRNKMAVEDADAVRGLYDMLGERLSPEFRKPITATAKRRA